MGRPKENIFIESRLRGFFSFFFLSSNNFKRIIDLLSGDHKWNDVKWRNRHLLFWMRINVWKMTKMKGTNALDEWQLYMLLRIWFEFDFMQRKIESVFIHHIFRIWMIWCYREWMKWSLEIVKFQWKLWKYVCRYIALRRTYKMNEIIEILQTMKLIFIFRKIVVDFLESLNVYFLRIDRSVLFMVFIYHWLWDFLQSHTFCHFSFHWTAAAAAAAELIIGHRVAHTHIADFLFNVHDISMRFIKWRRNKSENRKKLWCILQSGKYIFNSSGLQ